MIDERGFVDISSTQRLATYTRDLGIESARSASVSRPDSAKASPRVQASQRAQTAGVQVSLSANAQAIAHNTTEAAELSSNSSDAPSSDAPLIERADRPNRGPRSNRSLAIEAYQRVASEVTSGSIQVIA